MAKDGLKSASKGGARKAFKQNIEGTESSVSSACPVWLDCRKHSYGQQECSFTLSVMIH